MSQESRIFTRLPFDSAVEWRDLTGEDGHAAVRDVSRGGFRLSLGRYLRPGPVVTVTFDHITFNGAPVELDAAVVWCKPTDQPDTFLAGLKIIHGGAATLAAASEVFYAAMDQRAVGA